MNLKVTLDLTIAADLNVSIETLVERLFDFLCEAEDLPAGIDSVDGWENVMVDGDLVMP